MGKKNLNFLEAIAHSMQNRLYFLLVVSLLALLSSTVISKESTSPLMTLPQIIAEESEEANLKCLFEIFRRFGYQRSSTPLPKIEHLYNHVQPGVDRIIDLNTLLLQYFDLQDIDDKETGIKYEPRKDITSCKLQLEPAIARCRSAYPGMECAHVVYGEGEFNRAPFVSPVCPEGFQRFGCCTCLRKCNYVLSVESDVTMGEDPENVAPWTMTNYCLKKPAYNSIVKRGQDKQEVGIKDTLYEIVEEVPGGFVFVQECSKDFKRVGTRQCVAVCPLGWPDMGRKCLKQGQLIFFPFVWQPGDGKVKPKEETGSPPPAKKVSGKK